MLCQWVYGARSTLIHGSDSFQCGQDHVSGHLFISCRLGLSGCGKTSQLVLFLDPQKGVTLQKGHLSQVKMHSLSLIPIQIFLRSIHAQ